MNQRPVVYHIPVCPFSQRLEILLALKGCSDAVEFRVVDITKPRAPDLLAKTRGSTVLPVLELPDGGILKESLVLLGFLDETIGDASVRRPDPQQHATEQMLISREGPFTTAGYLHVMNQDRSARESHENMLLALYRDLNSFLEEHNPKGPWLFEEFGLAEAVFTPMFMRFWFLDYYEDFSLPDSGDYRRVTQWREACLEHPAAQQVTREEIVKLYYDYAMGAGNGALPDGRSVSSFVFDPPWENRPWPLAEKFQGSATDKRLGLT